MALAAFPVASVNADGFLPFPANVLRATLTGPAVRGIWRLDQSARRSQTLVLSCSSIYTNDMCSLSWTRRRPRICIWKYKRKWGSDVSVNHSW